MRNCDMASATFSTAGGGNLKCNKCHEIMSPPAAKRHRNAHDKPKAEVVPVVKAEHVWGGLYQIRCPRCRLMSNSMRKGVFVLKPTLQCGNCSKKFKGEL